MLPIRSVVAPYHGGCVEKMIPSDVRPRDPDFYKAPSLATLAFPHSDGCMYFLFFCF